MRFALTLCLLACSGASMVAMPQRGCTAAELAEPEGVSTREARLQAARGVPLQRLRPNISQEIREVLDNPSYFRRMPSQQITCDPQMFTFLVRRPEVMVNIWEVMGITKVTAKRTSPVSFLADDGVGTACKCELVYSDSNLHIYLGYGTYDGTMAPRKVTGRCVCLLRTEDRSSAVGEPNLAGTMDVFLKVDNFGADLLTRSIGPFVGKTADYNFIETSKFISQISQVCQTNPSAAQALAMRLDKIDDATRLEFAEIVTRIASTSADQYAAETLVVGRNERSAVTAQSLVGQTEHIALPPQSHPIRYEPTVEIAEASLGAAAELHATPAAIAPRKASIFMRR